VIAGVDSLAAEDVDGAWRDWLLARPAAEVVVLRPDRYVAAICTRAELAEVTGALRSSLGTTGAVDRAG
jgi:3-(3-hydroxy-phenyl)propionate hydroxylase